MRRISPTTMKPLPDSTDFWVLAGQSNMSGAGCREPYEPPSDNVYLYTLRDEWEIAREPFSIDRYGAVDKAFSIMRSEMEKIEDYDEYRKKQKPLQIEQMQKGNEGGGLGLPFAKALSEYTGRPIGLIFCAKGDTRMEEWDPEWNGTPYMALYNAMLRRIRKVDRPIKGVIWYQGESDSFDGKGNLYHKRMLDFVRTLRSDLNQSDLPFFHVQIGNCFMQTEEELPQWNMVQESQRCLEGELSPGGMCSAIDLPLTDGIHIATSGQRRLGRRLARIVRSNLYGDSSVKAGPRPLSVTRNPDDACVIYLHFGSVNGKLLPKSHVAGFSLYGPGKSRNILCAACVTREDSATIKLIAIEPVASGCTLWYGKGLATFCNLTDSEDMAAPMFGPWEID